MNKVILMGRLTSDPKMDWTRSEDSNQRIPNSTPHIH